MRKRCWSSPGRWCGKAFKSNFCRKLYVLAQSNARIDKERVMRRRQLKGLVKRLKELQSMDLKRDQLLLKLGAAHALYPSGWRFVDIQTPKEKEPVNAQTFTFKLRRDKLRQVRRREGHYLLRSNLGGENPAKLWQFYIQLTRVEEAFKDLKNDLSVRPIYHQLEHRIEAHIFAAFLAYCLHDSLHARLRPLGTGLTPRSLIEKFAAIQMLDVYFPTTDGQELVFTRYTQPEKDHKMLLAQLGWEQPPQSPPKITPQGQLIQEWLWCRPFGTERVFSTTCNFSPPPVAKVGLAVVGQRSGEDHPNSTGD